MGGRPRDHAAAAPAPADSLRISGAVQCPRALFALAELDPAFGARPVLLAYRLDGAPLRSTTNNKETA